MNSEEDQMRIMEAKGCEGCIGWHKHCKAECCKVIFLNIAPSQIPEGGRFFTIKQPKDFKLSDRRYYMLRGVEVIRGLLRFPKKDIVTLGNQVAYVRVCDLLDENNLCKGHPDNKPEICKALTLETAPYAKQMGFRITDNCLFKYKMKGGNQHEQG